MNEPLADGQTEDPDPEGTRPLKSSREVTLLTTEKFRVVQASLGDGRPTKAVIRHPGSVCVLPLLEDGQICLIRNYRVSVAKTLLEVPAGTMEPPEPADVCAQRELEEETGYRADRWTKLGGLYLAPGFLDEQAHVYLAEHLSPGPQRLEADEDIENHLVSWSEADQLIASGEIQDAKTIATLYLWRRHLGR